MFNDNKPINKESYLNSRDVNWQVKGSDNSTVTKTNKHLNQRNIKVKYLKFSIENFALINRLN